MIVNFICDLPGELAVPVDDDYPTLLDSPLFYRLYASLRIRCLLPLVAVGRAMPARLISYRTALKSEDKFGPDDRFVLFKVGGGALRAQPGLADAISDFVAKRSGAIVYDTCDPQHKESDPAIARLQTEILRRAAVVTCATTELAAELTPLTTAPVRTIEDAVDCAPAPATFAPADPVRIVWFGWMSETRFTTLANHLAAIQATVPDRRFDCLILAQDLPPEWTANVNAFLAQSGKGRAQVSHQRWLLPAAWDAIARRDIALIPHDPSGDDRFKSHNRLSTAIQRGVFAVASPIPAYRALADHAWLGPSLADGVKWALAHPAEALARIASGQMRVAELYGPDVIGAEWVRVLKEFMAR